MTRTPAGWDVDSPVQAEVFVVVEVLQGASDEAASEATA